MRSWFLLFLTLTTFGWGFSFELNPKSSDDRASVTANEVLTVPHGGS